MRYRPSRRLIIATSVIVTVAVGFVLLLPEIVRRVATNRLGNVIKAPVSIADVDLNLFTGRAHVENFFIGAAELPILSVPAFSLRFSPTALFTGRIDVERLVLHNPSLAVERTGPDRYNVLEIVKPPSTETDGGTPSLSINQIEIQDGKIVFVDRTQDPDYQLTLGSINLTAGPIATLSEDAVPATGFRAGFKIGDGSVTVAGTSHVFRNSPSVELQAEMSEVEIEAFHVYLPYGGRLNSRNSLVNGHVQYLFNSRAGKTIAHSLNANLTIGLNGNVGPSDVKALKQKMFWSHIREAKGGNYQEALVNVYKSLNGITQPLTPLSQITEASLERFVMEHIEIAPKDITELAQNRAELVRLELIKRGVDPNRLLTTAQAATAADTAPRVSIELVS